jgi:RimJ/RimL family protein N-acetyltransferase
LDEHIEGFQAAVAEVARERRFLATLDGFTLQQTHQFVYCNRSMGMPNFVAVVDGKVVGWCDICRMEKPVLRHTGVLGMGILKDFRGKGIGSALISRTLEAARAAGILRVELTVREDNVNAIALYTKVGFEKEGLQRKAACVDGVFYNHLMMALLFPDND